MGSCPEGIVHAVIISVTVGSGITSITRSIAIGIRLSGIGY